jgi:hypothetical protein
LQSNAHLNQETPGPAAIRTSKKAALHVIYGNNSVSI